jgi:hypothetical protein
MVQALRDDLAHNTRYKFQGSSIIIGHDMKYADTNYNVIVYLVDFAQLEERPSPDAHIEAPIADYVLLDVVDLLIWCVYVYPPLRISVPRPSLAPAHSCHGASHRGGRV